MSAARRPYRGTMPVGSVRRLTEEVTKGVEWPFHVAGVGQTRRGKTWWVISPFLNQVLPATEAQPDNRGEGGIFFDPTTQAIGELKRYLGEEAVAERVVEITREPGKPNPSWNMFDMYDPDGTREGEIEAKLDAFANMYASANGWNVRTNTRAINLTRQACEVLLELGRLLPQECQPTIFQIRTLLENDNWRAAVLKKLRPGLREYWNTTYLKIGKDASPPVTHLVYLAKSSAALRALLGSSKSTFDFRSAMDQKKIVLACLGDPGDTQKVLANLLLFDLIRAFFSRGRQDTPRFVFVLDELLTYDGAVGTTVCDLLEQVGKYGGVGFYLTQNLLRLKDDTRIALLTNRSLVVATTLERTAANLVGAGWTGCDPDILIDMPAYEFICDAELYNGQRSQFKLRALRPDELFGAHRHDELVPGLNRRLADQGRTGKEVTPELETLDQRILDALDGRGAHRPEVSSQVPEGYVEEDGVVVKRREPAPEEAMSA